MADLQVSYDSIEALARVAIPFIEDGSWYLQPDWSGVGTTAELKALARDGWAAEAPAAMEIARSVVDTVQQDHHMPAFRPLWDVSGCEVDVARYLSGEPENMIDYEMVSTPRPGRVISLCASVCYSSAVKPATVKRRGHAVAALAFALSEMGLSVELWADASTEHAGYIASTRVLVKGANDELDLARIMFAYAHPAMQRALTMGARFAWTAEQQRTHQVGRGGGYPVAPAKDMPEGTIYLPAVRSSTDVPAAKDMLMRHLTELGLLGG